MGLYFLQGFWLSIICDTANFIAMCEDLPNNPYVTSHPLESSATSNCKLPCRGFKFVSIHTVRIEFSCVTSHASGSSATLQVTLQGVQLQTIVWPVESSAIGYSHPVESSTTRQ